MTLFLASIGLGLFLLVWSADKFVDGASDVARYLGMSPLLIGMVIIGFGTSAPEMVVSAMSSANGNPGIALGNAYGSNITNIALILGLTSLLMPINVHSQVVRKELPILVGITALTVGLIADLELSRLDAVVLLVVFLGLMGWTIKQGLSQNKDVLEAEMASELETHHVPIKKSILLLMGGLVILVVSSRMLVYGAVGVATSLGVSEIIVGLTVVAVGTSLPELAASVIAARKGESDLALGNVLGSNLFNTLAVVGISGSIAPSLIDREIFYRDISVMSGLTLLLFFFSYGFRGKARIARIEGAVLLAIYIGYTYYLISTAIKSS
jgi:cation:H+ antiporter